MSCVHKLEYSPAIEVLDKNTEKLVGEILTILEAVIPGDRQAEATKATIKQAVWRFNRGVKIGFDGIMTTEGGL